MHALPQRPLQWPTPDQMADVRLAASTMTGAQRRAFQAAMTVQDCDGTARLAESVCGWGRHTVTLGLAERRTGILGRGAQFACRGRQRWEDEHPHVAEALHQLAEAPAHQDPTFRTSLASTRLTAHGALEALRAHGAGDDQRPAPSPMAEVLHRMGFRLRHVVKATPHKKRKATAALFDNIKTKRPRPRHRQASNA